MLEDVAAHTVIPMLENRWFLEFGPTKEFCSDSKFTCGFMNAFAMLHRVEELPRHVRKLNENGIVERKKGIFKIVVERNANHDKK